jgi:protocatechuate 3,4-dioxygenase beta subunit
MDDTRDSSRSVVPVLVGLCILALLLLIVFYGWFARERAVRAAREAEMQAHMEARLAASAGAPVERSLPPRALEDAFEWEEEQAGEHATVLVRVGCAPLGEAHRGAEVTLFTDSITGTPAERAAPTDTLGIAGFYCEAGEEVREVFVRATRDRPAASRKLSHALVAGRLFGSSVIVGKGARVSGRVVDERGEPVSAASVSLVCGSLEHFQGRSEQPDRECTSDAAGRFALDAVGPAYVAWALGEKGACSSISTGTVGEEEQIDIDDLVLLPPPAGVSEDELGARWILGRVLDATGEPAAGARVETLERTRTTTETDLDGRFLLVRRSAQLAGLCVNGGAHGTAWLAPVDPSAGSEAPLVVRLEEPRSLVGRLTDEAGMPVGGAEIALRGDRELELEDGTRLTCLAILGNDRATTDAEGRFSVEKLWPGRFALEVRHPDEPDLSMHLEAESGAAPLELVWDRPLLSRVVIEGLVRDARNGTAIDAFDVAALRPAEEPGTFEGPRRSFLAAEGRFRIAALPPAAYRLRIEAPGYLAEERDLGLLAEGVHASEIELVPLREVELAFQDPDGVPLTAGTLTFRRLDGTEVAPLEGLVADGRTRAVLPAELLELELALPGNARLSYLLDLATTDGDPSVFVVDLDAHESRESASVLVCAALPGASGIEAGWVPSLSRAELERLASGDGFTVFDGERLELTLRDRHGALVGRGTLEREDGAWRSSFALAHRSAAVVEEEELPRMRLDLPRKGFRLEVQAPGFERLEIAVDALLPVDLDSSRALVLREARR